MALVFTRLIAVDIVNTANQASYVSPSFTPVANRLYLLGVAHSDSPPETTIPTISTTTGLNFVRHTPTSGNNTNFYNTIASPTFAVTFFRAMKSSGLSNGTFTVNFGDASTGCIALLIEVTGALTTGTDGADAIVQLVTNAADNLNAVSVTLSAFAHANNRPIMFVGSAGNGVITPETNWSLIDAPGSILTPTMNLNVLTASVADNTATGTLAANPDWGAIAAEIAHDPGVSTAVPIMQQHRRRRRN